MRDLQIRQLIPFATAVASLVTVGCGSSKENRVAKAFCKGQQKCDEEYFNEEFDSFSECVDYFEDIISEYTDGAREYGTSEKCIDAFLDYTLCYSNAYADSCDYDTDACEREYDKLIEICEDD